MTTVAPVGRRRGGNDWSLPWCVAVVVGALALVPAALASADLPAAAVALLLMPLGLLWLVRRRLGPFFSSPTWIVTTVLAAVGAGGYLFSGELNGQAGGGIVLSITPDLAHRTALLFAAFTGAIAVGATASSLCAKVNPTTSIPPVVMGKQTQQWCLVACCIPAALVVQALGTTLLHRDEYLAGSGASAAFILGQTLALGALAALGYVAAIRRAKGWLTPVALIALYMCLLLALGSRRLALVPIFVAVGVYVARVAKRPSVTVLVGGAASLLLLPIPLYLRSLNEHGLLPYVAHLSGFSYGDVDWATALNNVLIAFPTSGYSAFVEPPIPHAYLWIELNPLPGRWVGWNAIASTLTLNRWTPYSSVGELGNYGPVALAVIGALVGGVLFYLDRRVQRYVAARQALVAMLFVGLSSLFALQLLQYQLRTSIRLLVYAIALDMGLAWLARRRSQMTEAAPTRP